MEYSISSFTQEILKAIQNSPMFPYMYNEEVDLKKHPKRSPLHLKEALFTNVVPLPSGDNIMMFDLGSEKLELSHPYYHILQQAKYIRKRGRATEKSKGSQAKVEVAKRDYEKVSWNGKTFTKEYSRNVRGKRDKMGRATQYIVDYNGEVLKINRESNEYLNRHYQYFDKILDSEMPNVAQMFNMRLGRKQDSGLGEEYSMQEESNFTTNLVDILNSFD